MTWVSFWIHRFDLLQKYRAHRRRWQLGWGVKVKGIWQRISPTCNRSYSPRVILAGKRNAKLVVRTVREGANRRNGRTCTKMTMTPCELRNRRISIEICLKIMYTTLAVQSDNCRSKNKWVRHRWKAAGDSPRNTEKEHWLGQKQIPKPDLCEVENLAIHSAVSWFSRSRQSAAMLMDGWKNGRRKRDEVGSVPVSADLGVSEPNNSPHPRACLSGSFRVRWRNEKPGTRRIQCVDESFTHQCMENFSRC